MTQIPTWLESLIDVIAECMEHHDQIGPLGYLYNIDADLWEIIVYPCSLELAGETRESTLVAPRFSLDLELLRSAFEQLETIFWVAHDIGPYDTFGPHIALEGIYQGNKVYLQILAYAPDDEDLVMPLDIPGIKRPVN